MWESSRLQRVHFRVVRLFKVRYVGALGLPTRNEDAKPREHRHRPLMGPIDAAYLAEAVLAARCFHRDKASDRSKQLLAAIIDRWLAVHTPTATSGADAAPPLAAVRYGILRRLEAAAWTLSTERVERHMIPSTSRAAARRGNRETRRNWALVLHRCRKASAPIVEITETFRISTRSVL